MFVNPSYKYLSSFLGFTLLILISEYIVCLRIALKSGKDHPVEIALNIMMIRNRNDAGILVGKFIALKTKGLGSAFN